MATVLRFAALLVALAPCAGAALDRGHFKGLEDANMAPLVAAFEGVEVYYLVGEKTGGSVLSRLLRANPKVNGLTDHGLIMYFNRKDAERARAIFEQQEKSGVRIVAGSAAKVVREQFQRRNAAPARSEMEPEPIVFITAESKIDVIEYLARDGAVVPMTMKGADGRPTVVSFLSRAKAMEVQAGLKAEGVTANRIGLDEKSFVRFILDQAKQGRAVQVTGF